MFYIHIYVYIYVYIYILYIFYARNGIEHVQKWAEEQEWNMRAGTGKNFWPSIILKILFPFLFLRRYTYMNNEYMVNGIKCPIFLSHSLGGIYKRKEWWQKGSLKRKLWRTVDLKELFTSFIGLKDSLDPPEY